MTFASGRAAALVCEVLDRRPSWVMEVFAHAYPDDAIEVPTTTAVTVLASDEDWEWIAAHGGAVTDVVVDGACRAVDVAGAGQWVVARAMVAGEEWVACTAANVAGSAAAGVGTVVLVLRPSRAGVPAAAVAQMRR